MHKQNRGMVEGPLFSGMMFYTIPIIISGILQLLFNAADLVIVGQFGQSGSKAVAAVGCTGAISALIINFFIGFSAGSGVTVAHAIGAKDSDYVHKAVHTIIPLATIGGTVISVVGVFLAEPLLILMDTPAEILPLAITYMQIIFAGTLPNVVYNFGSSVLRAAGDSKRPLYFLLIAGVINLGLNLIFVLCLKMDIAGVALATIISYLVSAVLVVFALIKRQDDCKLNLNKLRFHSEPLKKIFRMGFPAGIQSSIFSVSNVIIQTSLNGLDAIPQYTGVVAGSAAATNIQNFAFMTNEGFRQTAMNYIGQNSAAGRFDRVKKISHICFMSTAVLGVIVGILLTIFSKPLLSIYITDSPQAVYWGSVRMMYICLPFFIAGLMDVTTGVLRGLGQSVFPMIASIMGICVLRVAWIYTIFKIPAFHTPESLFISYIISWVITFIVQYVVIKIVINKKLRAHKK